MLYLFEGSSRLLLREHLQFRRRLYQTSAAHMSGPVPVDRQPCKGKSSSQQVCCRHLGQATTAGTGSGRRMYGRETHFLDVPCGTARRTRCCRRRRHDSWRARDCRTPSPIPSTLPGHRQALKPKPKAENPWQSLPASSNQLASSSSLSDQTIVTGVLCWRWREGHAGPDDRFRTACLYGPQRGVQRIRRYIAPCRACRQAWRRGPRPLPIPTPREPLECGSDKGVGRVVVPTTLALLL